MVGLSKPKQNDMMHGCSEYGQLVRASVVTTPMPVSPWNTKPTQEKLYLLFFCVSIIRLGRSQRGE